MTLPVGEDAMVGTFRLANDSDVAPDELPMTEPQAGDAI